MKVATWNVNSLRVRLPHVLKWLEREQPDVLALQETKMRDDEFPADAFSQYGYLATFSGQSAYNGVAMLSRAPLTDVAYDIGASARVPEFKSLSLGYPLLWDLIAWARDLGARWFDYGGVPAEDADAAHLERISDFKRRFEKQAVRIAEEWVFTPHPTRAAVASAVSRAATLLSRRRRS